MSYYYWFNRKELLKKAHDKHHKESGKEIAAIYYQRNKEDIQKETKRQVQKHVKRRKRSDKKKIQRKTL